MKRTLLIATAIAGLALSAPAFAQSVNGTVGVTGTVAARCAVTSGGSGSTFGGTIALGELTQTSGILRTDLQGATPVNGATLDFTVNCNGNDADVTLTATSMDAGLGVPANGFSSTLDYTAELDMAVAGGPTKVFTYATASNTETGGTTLGGALAAQANNVVVSAYSFATKGGNTDMLRASNNYAGQINVTITPTT